MNQHPQKMEKFLAQYERNFAAMNVEAMCEMVSYLKNYILGQNKNIQEDEIKNRFPREYDLLLAAAQSMDFSPAYKDLQYRISRNLIDLFQTSSLRSLSSRWNKLSEHQQKNILVNVQKFQAKAQSTGLVTVSAPPVKWMHKLFASTGGALVFGNFPDDNLIEFHREKTLLPDLASSLRILLHEQHHQMQHTLGHAHATGKLDEESPYAEDAAMLWHIYNNKAELPGRFGAPYRAMPHERDAYELEERLAPYLPTSRQQLSIGGAFLAAGVGIAGAIVLTGLLGGSRGPETSPALTRF